MSRTKHSLSIPCQRLFRRRHSAVLRKLPNQQQAFLHFTVIALICFSISVFRQKKSSIHTVATVQYDAELGTFQAAGQIINQVCQRVAYESIRGAARAAITAMKNHRGYRTRPSTMPTGNGGRTVI